MMLDSLREIDTLTEGECRAAQESIHDLKKQWVVRTPGVPFYTLGAASYLDAPTSFEHFRQRAEYYNPILRTHFAWLYERVVNRLQQVLAEPVECTASMSLPGFHIYLACKLFEKPIAVVHCDLQYELLKWENSEMVDVSRPLSFTLPIALPRTGGGLKSWDVPYEEILNLSDEAMQLVVRSRPKRYHAYHLGNMVLHSGHMMHQAAPGRDLMMDDERITLQGHAILVDGCWQLYW
jgi:hypothetical protein